MTNRTPTSFRDIEDELLALGEAIPLAIPDGVTVVTWDLRYDQGDALLTVTVTTPTTYPFAAATFDYRRATPKAPWQLTAMKAECGW